MSTGPATVKFSVDRSSLTKWERMMGAIQQRIEDIRRRQHGIEEHLKYRVPYCDCETCLARIGRDEITRRTEEYWEQVKAKRSSR